MKARSPHLSPHQRDIVRTWWNALQPEEYGKEKTRDSRFRFDRGDRARLRRAASQEDLLLARAAHALGQALHSCASPEADDDAVMDIGMRVYADVARIAGLLAHVKKDSKDGKTLAWRLGNAAAKKGQPAAMGEMRFRRLLKANTADDLYMQWVRAVKLGKHEADVAQLADDALCWLAHLRSARVHPSRNVKLYWAHDYYLDAKAQAGSESEQEKELNA